MKPSIHVVIPHMGPTIGLYATIASLDHGLWHIDPVSHHSVAHRYTVVSTRELTVEHERMKGIKFIQSGAIGPAGSREIGAKGSTEDWLLFTDDHVIFPSDFFDKLLALDKDVMHVQTQCLFQGPSYYGYDSDKRADDIDCSINFTPRMELPYPILSAGHGTFMVKRSVWEATGGYSNLFHGYSGEEVFFGLKAWMMGFEVWMLPGIRVWHYPNPGAAYKNRDEAFIGRHKAAQKHIEELKSKYTEAQARARVEAMCT